MSAANAAGATASETAEAATAAVSVRDVTKTFEGHQAVRGVSFDVGRTEFFAMLGPSGCGKTTTLKMIAGFEQPTSGEIAIAGRLPNGEPPFKRDVNTVFQNYALFPHLTVRDNVAFGLRMKGVGRRERAKTAEEALERVGLKGYGRRPVPGLSGGEQQRIAVARALVNRPAVLLLDEPLGALDLKLRKAMQAELKEIQHNAGIAFVYVTHDQSEALTMADRIAVMHGGRVMQIGDPVSIYERPESRFVADFIGESSFLEATALGPRGSGRLEVELAGGTVVCGVGGAQPRGGAVTVAVRPEKVRLAPAQDGDAASGEENVVSGVVTSVVYGGSDTVYELLAPGGTLKARVAMDPAHGHATSAFAAGDRVCARFAVAATVVIEPDA
ncbi:MAG TPA: ABC transporter ATP-binding protein [Conexibacter sp.]|nr:ABC transporter ATP-binding protein [Conexibacter sp.]